MTARIQHGHFLLAIGAEPEDGSEKGMALFGYFPTRSAVKKEYLRVARRLLLSQFKPMGLVFACKDAEAAAKWLMRDAVPPIPQFRLSLTTSKMGVMWEAYHARPPESR